MSSPNNSLPPLIDFGCSEFEKIHYGPTDSSNWLIPDHILMSAYPGDLDEFKAKQKIAQLVDSGINCFVNLQEETELRRFKPYKNLVEDYCKEKSKDFSEMEFLSLEIPDGGTVSDNKILPFVQNELIPRSLNPQKKILIHCFGGHGRTGTVAALLLSHLYKINAQETLKRISLVHNCRLVKRRIPSPETWGQVEQVERLSHKQ